MRALPLVLLLVGSVACAAGAEVYRCEEGPGAPRYTSDASSCADPKRQPVEVEIQRVARPAKAEVLPAIASVEPDLASVFVPAPEIPGGWEMVAERPGDPGADEEMVRLGVRATEIRHYTRYLGPLSQVCSVELWSFGSEGQAKRAQRITTHPGWRLIQGGAVLVMLHGVQIERGRGTDQGLFPECHDIGERTHARIAES